MVKWLESVFYEEVVWMVDRYMKGVYYVGKNVERLEFWYY